MGWGWGKESPSAQGKRGEQWGVILLGHPPTPTQLLPLARDKSGCLSRGHD